MPGLNYFRILYKIQDTRYEYFIHRAHTFINQTSYTWGAGCIHIVSYTLRACSCVLQHLALTPSFCFNALIPFLPFHSFKTLHPLIPWIVDALAPLVLLFPCSLLILLTRFILLFPCSLDALIPFMLLLSWSSYSLAPLVLLCFHAPFHALAPSVLLFPCSLLILFNTTFMLLFPCSLDALIPFMLLLSCSSYSLAPLVLFRDFNVREKGNKGVREQGI